MSGADTAWMAGSVGISSHWTANTVGLDGSHPEFECAVEAFDAGEYARVLSEAGARHCIFTLAHARQMLPMPLQALDGVLQGRTARRDLVGDIIDALSARGIRFIAYYNHSCNGMDDVEWKEACGYAAGGRDSLDRFASRICGIVGEISRRYGDGISAWWFDSGYSVDDRGPDNTITCATDGWNFPWSDLAAAARSGNPRAAMAVNAGVGTHYLYTPECDYYAGETVRLDEKFTPDPLPGMQDHRWICLDSPQWVLTASNCAEGFVGPQFEDAEVSAFVGEHTAAGRMVTFNLLIDAAGRVNPAAIAQVRRVLGRRS